jgi:hypothetical protein
VQDALRKLRSPRIWIRGLVAAFIGGGASAFSTDQGMSLAQRIGIDVPTLNLKALGIVFLSAGLSSAAAYLKQSPLPPVVSPEQTDSEMGQ